MYFISFLQYLCCLSTSRSSTDKLAFDVGLQEDTTGRISLASALLATLAIYTFYENTVGLILVKNNKNKKVKNIGLYYKQNNN